MKYILVAFFSFGSLITNAQKLSYNDGTIEFENSTVQTIDVVLNPKVDIIKDKFGEWMDDNYDVDLDGKKLLFFDKELMTANGVVIPPISPNKIDLKVKIDETNAGYTKLNVFASFGYNNWITEKDNPLEFAALRGVVYDFVAEYLPEYYLEKIKESEEKISNLNEKQDDLIDEVKGNKEEIEKLEEENKELMMKLKENQSKLNESKMKMSQRNSEYKMAKRKVSKM